MDTREVREHALNAARHDLNEASVEEVLSLARRYSSFIFGV